MMFFRRKKRLDDSAATLDAKTEENCAAQRELVAATLKLGEAIVPERAALRRLGVDFIPPGIESASAELIEVLRKAGIAFVENPVEIHLSDLLGHDLPRHGNKGPR